MSFWDALVDRLSSARSRSYCKHSYFRHTERRLSPNARYSFSWSAYCSVSSSMASMDDAYLEGRKEVFYLTTHSTHFIYCYMEGSVLFNDALNTFYLRLYGIRHMVKDHSDSERENPLLPHGLLFPSCLQLLKQR